MTDDALERLATAAIEQGLVDAVFTRVPSPIGPLLVVRGPRGLCRIAFDHEPEDAVLAEVAGVLGRRIVASRRELAPVATALEGYFDGAPVDLDMAVDLALVRSRFGRRVLEELRAVPRGAVTSYGDLSARVGHPRAARATGTALGRNPIPIVVPCHRVLPSTGGVGGYGGGIERKRFLLALEGAPQTRG